MTDVVWAVIVAVVGIVVFYGLGRLHERDRVRRRGRVAPVVPLRRVGSAATTSVTHYPLADGASQVRIVAAPRAYDWQKRDGGVG